jgi:hypothetical protein
VTTSETRGGGKFSRLLRSCFFPDHCHQLDKEEFVQRLAYQASSFRRVWISAFGGEKIANSKIIGSTAGTASPISIALLIKIICIPRTTA